VDIFLVVDGADHPLYRRPHRIADILRGEAIAVRSVAILDRKTGMMNAYRDGEVS
jgi:hypothetical protein